MVGKAGKFRGFGHSNRKPQGFGVVSGGPINLAAPSIAGTLTNGSTLTCTPGTWSSGTPSRQWYRDGVAIPGQLALTYTYNSATDDGCYITVVETNAGSTATSNALIAAGAAAVFYNTSFAGTDGTDLHGFENWDMRIAGGGSVTWSPTDKSSTITLSNLNMTGQRTSGSGDVICRANTASSGKAYFEVRLDFSVGSTIIGVSNSGQSTAAWLGLNLGTAGYASGGNTYNNGSALGFGASLATGDIVGVAIDTTTRTVWFSKNGVWQSGNPNTNTGGTVLGGSLPIIPAFSVNSNSSILTARFQAGTFSYSIPTGFSAFDSAATTLVAATGRLQVSGNDLFQVGYLNDVLIQHAAPSNDFDVETTIAMPAVAAGDFSTVRNIMSRWTDKDNYVLLQIQNNGWQLIRRVGGANTSVSGFVSLTINDTDRFVLRSQGNYARIFRAVGAGAMTELAESAAANGGLGFDISAVPASSKAAIGGIGNSSNAVYPYRFLYDYKLSSILTSTLVIGSATVENTSSPLSKPRVNVTGSVTGSVTQLQVAVIGATGAVLLPWSDVSGLSGGSFTIQTADLPDSAQGTNVTVWVRDKINKSVSASVVSAIGYYATVFPTVIGLNEGYYAQWSPTDPMNDIVQRGRWARADYSEIPSANYNPATLNPIAYTSTDTSVILVIGGQFYNVGDTYVLTYPPGMTVNADFIDKATVSTPFSGGTGEITITAAGDVGINLRFSGPIPGGGIVASFKKKGLVSTKRYTAKLANDYTEAGFKITRYMTPLGINTAPRFNPTASAPLTGDAQGLTPAFMCEFANDTGADVWFNIHHLADDSYVIAAANYFAANLAAGRKVWIEWSNELWNPFFVQHEYARIQGTAAGYWNTNGDAGATSFVYGGFAGDTGATTVAYTSGTKVFGNLYGTGWQVWQAVGDQPIGSVLGATSNANWTVIINNQQTGVAGWRYQAQRSKEVFALFDAAFGGTARARTMRVLGAWTLDSPATLGPRMSWNNLYQSLDRVAIAPYWGNDLGDYTGNHRPGWGATEKALYATDLTAWKNAFFSVVNADIDSIIGTARTLKHSLESMLRQAPYNLPADTIRLCSYECNWHVTMGNYPDTTLRATAFNSLRADPRIATAAQYYLSKIKAALGGEHVFFDSVGPTVPAGSAYPQSWGIMYAQGDRTMPVYNAIKSWIAANT